MMFKKINRIIPNIILTAAFLALSTTTFAKTSSNVKGYLVTDSTKVPSSEIRYSVIKDDNLHSITQKYCKSSSPANIEAILKANNIVKPKLLQKDSEIIIPCLSKRERVYIKPEIQDNSKTTNDNISCPQEKVIVEKQLPNIVEKVEKPVFKAHKVMPGETFSHIADKYYKDPRIGKLLAKYFNIEPEKLEIGTQLNLPKLEFLLAQISKNLKKNKIKSKVNTTIELPETITNNREILTPKNTLKQEYVEVEAISGTSFSKMAKQVLGDVHLGDELAKYFNVDPRKIVIGTIFSIPKSKEFLLEQISQNKIGKVFSKNEEKTDKVEIKPVIENIVTKKNNIEPKITQSSNSPHILAQEIKEKPVSAKVRSMLEDLVTQQNEIEKKVTQSSKSPHILENTVKKNITPENIVEQEYVKVEATSGISFSKIAKQVLGDIHLGDELAKYFNMDPRKIVIGTIFSIPTSKEFLLEQISQNKIGKVYSKNEGKTDKIEIEPVIENIFTKKNNIEPKITQSSKSPHILTQNINPDIKRAETRTYIVKEGDTFSGIAEQIYKDIRFGRLLPEYFEINPLKLKIGEKLILPKPSVLFANISEKAKAGFFKTKNKEEIKQIINQTTKSMLTKKVDEIVEGKVNTNINTAETKTYTAKKVDTSSGIAEKIYNKRKLEISKKIVLPKQSVLSTDISKKAKAGFLEKKKKLEDVISQTTKSMLTKKVDEIVEGKVKTNVETGETTTYAVEKGDTFINIAKQIYGKKGLAIGLSNYLGINPRELEIGEKLVLPKQSVLSSYISEKAKARSPKVKTKQKLEDIISVGVVKSREEISNLSSSALYKLRRKGIKNFAKLIGAKIGSTKTTKEQYEINLQKVYNTFRSEFGEKVGVIKLLVAKTHLESGFNENAVSSTGAIGISQLTSWVYNNKQCKINPLNLKDSLLCQSKHFKGLLSQFNNNIDKALFAYNQGVGKYMEAQAHYVASRKYSTKGASKLENIINAKATRKNMPNNFEQVAKNILIYSNNKYEKILAKSQLKSISQQKRRGIDIEDITILVPNIYGGTNIVSGEGRGYVSKVKRRVSLFKSDFASLEQKYQQKLEKEELYASFNKLGTSIIKKVENYLPLGKSKSNLEI